MRKSAEWQRFERTGKIADYLAYVSAKTGEDPVTFEGKDADVIYAGYHHGDRNHSESGTSRGI